MSKKLLIILFRWDKHSHIEIEHLLNNLVNISRRIISAETRSAVTNQCTRIKTFLDIQFLRYMKNSPEFPLVNHWVKAIFWDKFSFAYFIYYRQEPYFFLIIL